MDPDKQSGEHLVDAWTVSPEIKQHPPANGKRRAEGCRVPDVAPMQRVGMAAPATPAHAMPPKGMDEIRS